MEWTVHNQQPSEFDRAQFDPWLLAVVWLWCSYSGQTSGHHQSPPGPAPGRPELGHSSVGGRYTYLIDNSLIIWLGRNTSTLPLPDGRRLGGKQTQNTNMEHDSLSLSLFISLSISLSLFNNISCDSNNYSLSLLLSIKNIWIILKYICMVWIHKSSLSLSLSIKLMSAWFQNVWCDPIW